MRGLVHGRSCYLVPRDDGSVVVGATVEEKGFDLSVQAGAVGDLLDDARRLVPALEEYELVDTTTGLRPGSPDNAPIVGATEVRGLVVATGHYRNGFLLAPVTASEVVGRHRRPDLRAVAAAVRALRPVRPGPVRPHGRPTGAGTRRRTGPVGDQRMSAALVNGTPWDGPRGHGGRPGVGVVSRRRAASPWPATATSFPESRWEKHPVMAGDRIEIVTAAAGG